MGIQSFSTCTIALKFIQYMLMRYMYAEGSQQGHTNNKAKPPKAITFPKENELPQVGFKPMTLDTNELPQVGLNPRHSTL